MSASSQIPICADSTVVSHGLVALLEWQHRAEWLDALFSRHRQLVEQRMLELMRAAKGVDKSIGGRLLMDYLRLPEVIRDRLVRAPEMGARMRYPLRLRIPSLPFLTRSITAERALLQSQYGSAIGWTALGDRYIAGGSNYICYSGGWRQDDNLIAPFIASGIPVDFVSPWAVKILSIDTEFEECSGAETSAIVGNLNAAHEALYHIGPSVARIFSKTVTVVIPRKATTRSDRVGSTSSASHIGRIVLTNPHLASRTDIMDALVHEMTHSILYLVDLFDPFLSPGAPNGVTLTSPWSGNALSLYTYLHACFVWYALARFWNQACELSYGDVGRHLRLRAQKGFRHGNPADALIPHAQYLSAAVLEAALSLKGRLGDVL